MSFIFGGLQPIWSRVFLDAVSVSLLGFCTSTEPSDANTLTLLVPILLTLSTAGLTKRWTLSFPMILLVLLQQSRRLSIVHHHQWISILVFGLSVLLLIVTITLCIAFPPLTLPRVMGPYQVGVVDLQMPIAGGDHIIARILYPTYQLRRNTIPYLKPSLASSFLRESVRAMAPPPINSCTWILDNWKLIRLEVQENAPPVHDKKLPLIAFSHGLGGSAALYSHVTQSMAANGYVVIAVDHTDGSSPLVVKKNGNVVKFDESPITGLWSKGKELEYTLVRRKQTELRTAELIAAAEGLRLLNVQNITELEELGISFVNRLDTDSLHVMGHSFGGSTALTMAFRRPDIVRSVVVHEPIADWTPDDVRMQLFPQAAIDSYHEIHTGGTGGRGDVVNPLPTTYNTMPSLFLFSQEYHVKKWASVRFFQHMFHNGFLGLGEHIVLDEMHHNEFSDMCMLTPLWLTRALKLTGGRNPIDTANEVVRRSLEFLDGKVTKAVAKNVARDPQKKTEH